MHLPEGLGIGTQNLDAWGLLFYVSLCLFSFVLCLVSVLSP